MTLKISPIGYGCWRFAGNSTQEADRLIRTALDQGLTFIDTADIYGFGEARGFGGAEEVLGDVLAASPDLRDQMVLATKGGITPPRPYDSSRDYLMGALEKSLKRLRVDHIDLYQVHRPDMMTPMAELADTLETMIKSGKVGAVGTSNFTVAQNRALAAHMSAPLATLQPEFSALQQTPITDGTLDYAMETGATVLAWSPLGGGRLFTEDAPVQRTIGQIALKHEVSATVIALAFTRSHGANVTPIIGTQRVARIEDAAKASELTLEARDFYDIVEAYRGDPMP